jgi:endonuclease/exonuclease/phosphatase family metal-dependent hydrolase
MSENATRWTRRISLGSLTLVLGSLVLAMAGCATVRNYGRHPGPRTMGRYAPVDRPFDGNLEVVTFNIQLSKRVDDAIFELSETPELADADFLLLQEMDDLGVERMARLLQYDYVYYPASVQSKNHRNFGNAVLSKWPIRDAGRVDLPHENPKNHQRRIAVWADVVVDGREIRVYSAHTATIWLRTDEREDQVETLARRARDVGEMGEADRRKPVIVGGDFNTVSGHDVRALRAAFAEAGLTCASEGVDHTRNLLWGLRHVTMDHVFVRGLTERSCGRAASTEASDHLPVWVRLELDR